jgi:hypothetical protein
MFGGGNHVTRQHVPYLFGLDQPIPAHTPKVTNELAAARRKEHTDEIKLALTKPYRIRKLAFGLGHATILMMEKK